uniref:Large ribosomal subunit protein mL46 N-terminal domain-containing protein n=1 Tax=Amphimedon queenslandica TaxID=400682 RepID=A0A1X7VQ26_AMPQE
MFTCRRVSSAFLQRLICRSQSTGTPNVSVDPAQHIFSAACVQRFPLLGRVKTDLEVKVNQFKVVAAEKRSRLSDFELEEQKFAALKETVEKKAKEEGVNVSVFDMDTSFKDLQESFEKDFESFEPQPRETEPDRTGDVRSTMRKLDRILYLLVKTEDEWRMPQGGLMEGMNLCQTAQEQLTKLCGADLSVQFISNTPVACHSLPINKRSKASH